MFQRMTPVVLNLIIINVLVFLFLFLNQDNFNILQYFVLYGSDAFFPKDFLYALPDGRMFTTPMPLDTYADATNYAGATLVKFQPVQLVTSMFAHLTVMHIAFNMLALASLGPPVERVMSSQRFIALYLFSGLFSTVMIAFFDPISGFTLGASGAISGVALAFAYYYPDAKLGLLFLPISFKAKHFVLGFAALSVVLIIIGIINKDHVGGISHSGHLMGMAGAFIFLNRNKFLNLFRK